MDSISDKALTINEIIIVKIFPRKIETYGQKLKAIILKPIINKKNTRGITKRLLNKKKFGNW